MFHSDSRALFQVPRDAARRLMLLGIALYGLASLAYVAFGETNADEGWYLYASKLVLQGQQPYVDFAYTQMPLLPFVYGVLQIIQPGILLGRLTSIILSLGMLVMSGVIARRYGGTRASAITALVLGVFTFCIYFNTIVKTYALVSFFFTATLFVLSSESKAKYPLALVFAFSAALVRITALFFVAPVLLYVWVAGRTVKTRALVLVESTAFVLAAAYFLLPDWSSARWNLLDSHLSHWGTSPLADRFRVIIAERLSEIVQGDGALFMLCIAVLAFVLHSARTREWWRDRVELVALVTGLILFAGSHLVNGIWDVEYLVPSLCAVIPLLGIALGQFYAETESASRAFVQGGLIAVLLLLPLGESTQHTDLSGNRLPIAKLDRVAEVIAQNSRPGDKVLALEGLAFVLDAGRSVLPGMTLAQFSLQQMDTANAQRLHVVNVEMVAQAISQKAARVLVLTDTDLAALAADDPTGSESLRQAIAQNYRQVFVMTGFGEHAENVFVYVDRL